MRPPAVGAALPTKYGIGHSHYPIPWAALKYDTNLGGDRHRPRPGAVGRILRRETPNASTALSGGEVAGGDFVFVGAKAARTSPFSRFGTLAKSRLRPSSAATSSNSAGNILRSRWASSRPSAVLPGLVAVNLKGLPETSADPQRPHKFEAGEPFQVPGMPRPQLRVLRLLANEGVLHDGVAEVIYDCCDGEHAAHMTLTSFF